MDCDENVFQISLGDEVRNVYYYQQVSHEKDENIFKLPWGGALIRNCDANGSILKFRTVKEYEQYRKNENKQLWVLLMLKVFRHNNSVFGVFCCQECDSMSGTDKLAGDQQPRDILSRLCVHSKVCSTVLGDWRDTWDINVSVEDQLVTIVCNEDIQYQTLQKQSKIAVY